jgi:hypothetical protein
MNARNAWRSSLIESDLAPNAVPGGVISATLDANAIQTYRFVDSLIFREGFDRGVFNGWSLVIP